MHIKDSDLTELVPMLIRVDAGLQEHIFGFVSHPLILKITIYFQISMSACREL